MSNLNTFYRGRRLRKTSGIRDLVRETQLSSADLIQPYFVLEHKDQNISLPINSMPGQEQLGLKALQKKISEAVNIGIKAIILFGIPEHKDEKASQAYASDGIIQQAIRLIKESFPGLTVITDVCLCEYMSHGHCGIVQDGYVQNDPSLELLAETAISHAQAGADIVAPSDMMDGRIKRLRLALDQNGFSETPILSYAVKYASAFYGPFREAAQSAPSFGDRKTYQMDPANSQEALREAKADMVEGADMLMVKPALPYLDVLRSIRDNFNLPLVGYQVSGEYAMIKAASSQGWIEEKAAILESLLSIKRAGADLILTYFAEKALRLLG